jgi:hypothetical protein
MAHGREGPDIVMTTRYAGVSEIRSLSVHETDRTPDGSSAIDPLRSHLNQILHGPSTQQKAVNAMWESGVRKPTSQAEQPFVQMAISASPSYFAGEDGVVPGRWDQFKLDQWLEKTMQWLHKEYGADLAHVSLHLDEDTPHLHVLIIPTYEKKKGRKPSRRTKSGETEQAFADRLAAWEMDTESIRTSGRSSSVYWSKKWCRRIARQSYHEAMADLGIGYGKDLVGEGEPSPKRKETGTWVREQAAKVREDQAVIVEKTAAIECRENLLLSEKAAFSEKKKAHFDEITAQSASIKKAKADIKKAKADISKELDERERKLDERETRLVWIKDRIMGLVKAFGEAFGLPLPKSMHDAVTALEAEMKQRIGVRDPFLKSPPKDPGDDPGFGL